MPPAPPPSQRFPTGRWARCCGRIRLRALIALEEDPERRRELVEKLAAPALEGDDENRVVEEPRLDLPDTDLDLFDPQRRESASPSRGRIIALAVIALGTAVVVGGWLGSLSTSGDEIVTGPEGAAEASTVGVSVAEEQARQLRAVMGWLGLDEVVVAVRGETIEIRGEVPTSLDRNSVFEVVGEFPDGVEVDLDQLVVAEPVAVALPPPPPPGAPGVPPPGAPGVRPPGAPVVPPPEVVAALQRDLDSAFENNPVWFEAGSVMLDDQQLEFLAKDVVDLLLGDEALPVKIVVTADVDAPDDEEAAKLRVERATYVREFLVARGLPSLAVQIASSTADSDADNNGRPAGSSVERGGRVTLEVLDPALTSVPGSGVVPGAVLPPGTDSE